MQSNISNERHAEIEYFTRLKYKKKKLVTFGVSDGYVSCEWCNFQWVINSRLRPYFSI